MLTSGGQGAPFFRIFGQELVSKPSISLKKSWGATVERLSGSIYDPVFMIQSVRIICCKAVHFGLLLHQMDVLTALLYKGIH